MIAKLNIAHSQKGDKWGEEMMKYFKGRGIINNSIKKEMEVLYKLSSGYFSEQDYQYVLNPYGEEQRKRPELQGDPAKMRNYDIISPVVNAYMGDYISRGTKFQAINPSYDIEEEREKERQRLVLENLKAQFREELKANSGLDTELDNTQTSPQEIEQRVSKLPNTDAIEAQKALDFIRYDNETDRKYRLGYYDYITIGRVFSYRDGFKEETYFDIINPLDFNYVASQDCSFVEDGEAAWVEYSLTASEVIDRCSDILPKEALEYLEKNQGVMFDSETSFSYAYTAVDVVSETFNSLITSLGGRTNPANTGFKLTHMSWKSRRKLGKLIQYDYAGREAGYIEVDEDFIPRLSETVKWEYVNDVWEGYSLDDKYYFGVRPLPLQRGSLKRNKAKLPFNGITFGNRTSLPYTPVKKGKYFQELHNVVKYRLERVLAKNKDKLIPIPLGAINDSKKDMFATMYYADYHSWLFYDETNAKATAALSSVRPIDASLTQYIKAMYDISYNIRQEYYETLGVPRQKLADIKASDDVGNTQQALAQGNSLIEDMMVSFEELQERDFQCLTELAKYVWVDGKLASFTNSEGRLDQLNLGSDFSSKPIKVFIKGTKEERRKLEQLRAQIQPMAQNGYSATAIGEIIGSNNFEDLMSKLDFFEKQLQQSQRAAQESKQQSDQAIAQAENALEMEKLDREDYNKQADRDKDILIQAMKNQGTLASIILGAENGSKVPEGVEAALAETTKSIAEINLRREELVTKNKEIDTNLAIAKTNKNKYD